MVYNGKPFFLMDDLGGKPTIFGNIYIVGVPKILDSLVVRPYPSIFFGT